MPPRGTTGRSSSSTGARGPTGPKGQARSSPAGMAGGKAGAVSRTSSGPTGRRGPTGPKGEARVGAFSQSLRGSKSTGLRGPTGPNQERKAPMGRNAPTGRRGPTGPKGEPRAQTRSMVTGAGKRFGPMSNDVIDIRKRQGPIDPVSAYENRVRDIMRDASQSYQNLRQKTISTQAGRLSKTGAQYGPTRAKIVRNSDLNMQQRAARNRTREDRAPLDVTARTQGFRQEVSRMVPKTTLPSRMNMAEKAIGTYKRARNAFGNALYGNPPISYKVSPTRTPSRNK